MVDTYKRKLVNYFKKNLNKGYTEDSLRFALMSQGYSRSIVEMALETANKEIAEKLYISENTVKVHLSAIMEKMHVKNRQQAAVLAVEKGFISEAPPPNT